MTTVSMIVPSVPTRSDYLAEALTSVAKQTHQPDELIVINDKDGNGAAWSRNQALAMATCDFVAFLDDDDTLLPQHLEQLLEKQSDTNADVVYPAYQTQPADWWPIPDFINRLFTKEDRFIFPITTLVRREAALAVGGFSPLPDADIQAGEDWLFWNALIDAGYAFAHLPERSWIWRLHQSHHSGMNYKTHSHAVNPNCGPG